MIRVFTVLLLMTLPAHALDIEDRREQRADFETVTDLQPLHLFGDMDMREPLVIAKEKIARAALGAGYSIPKTPLARSLGIDDIEKKQ